jgi:GT2 family glycosyltransferase
MDKIAILIPFAEISKLCLKCIDGCLTQVYNNFEIILLPDSNIKLSSKYKSKNIRVIPTNDVTIAKKRNIGINCMPKVDYYAFIDSDAYPNRNWLKNGIEGFKQNKRIWAVGGPNIDPPVESLKEKAVGNALKSILVSGTRAFRKKIVKSRYCIDLPSCNLIIKKDVIRKIGLFDENLVTGEDMDFCNRIIKSNRKIFYKKDVVVYHHNRPLFFPFITQRLTYGYSVYRLFKKGAFIVNLFMLLPFAMFQLIICGGILAFLNEAVRPFWLAIISIYLIFLFFESIRYSESLIEIPLTFIALLLGNIMPGVGTTLCFIGKNLNIYKNYKKSYL